MPDPYKPEEGNIMVGPKYPGVQDSGYEYTVVPPRVAVAAARQTMPGPVYPGVDSENHYSHVPEKYTGELLHPLPLHGPGVESKNCYAPQEEKQPGQLVMVGPKFNGVDDQCKYIPDIKKVDTESLLVMAGPKFRGIDDSSKYNESPMKSPLDGTRLMTAPIFPGIKAENSYGPASMGF